MTFRFSILVAVLLALSGGGAAALTMHEVLGSNQTYSLKNPYFDILAVEVLSVDDEGAINAAPPTGEMRVVKVFRGDDRRGALRVVWNSPVGHTDLEDPKAGNYALKQSWRSHPVTGPVVGDRLIVLGKADKRTGRFSVHGGYVYRDTPANRAVVLRRMAPPERSLAIQLPLLLAVLCLPVVGFVLLAIARRVPAPKRTAIWRTVLIMPAAEIGLYAYYESGISSYSNIRIDMLVILPALLVALSLWPALWWRRRLRART